MLRKDDQEHPVPGPWRRKFEEIAAAFATGDFQLRNTRIDGVEPVERGVAEHIAANVAAYGKPLTRLNDATWERSVYRWMDGYWQVLVDLATVGEPVSDLTLHARLDEPNTCRLTIESVHVP
jgi:hypothetical protein